jgi:hypothetical protein
MRRRVARVSIVALVVVLVTLAFLTLGSPALAKPSARWPAQLERSFLVNCYATSNGKRAACRCSLAWLEKHYTYRQIATISLHDRRQFLRILAQAVIACR